MRLVAIGTSMRNGPSIRYLLLIANAFILLVPVFAVVFLHLWDGHLVRVTEQQLIAESVLIAEAWRGRLQEEQGEPAAESRRDALSPLVPQLPLNYPLESPASPATRFATERSGAEWRAGARVQPLMNRAQRSNLSAARILDATGCIVATTGEDPGACVDHLPEVQSALAGHYAAVARERILDGPTPALDSASRRGSVRVFTAMPVRAGTHVIGVVYMSRTSSSPLEAVWQLRYTVLAALILCVSLTVVVSLFFSRRIVRPVQAITTAAQAIARGEAPRSLMPSGFVPWEVVTLGTALERMTAQLTDRAAYISQFATTVSHELKTPLAGIRGAVELLREQWREMDDVQRERFLANVDADAGRMDRLVSRLLQLARIQSSPEAAEVIPVESFCATLVARYDGQVRLDASAAPATITMNPDHLESALRNLLDNAVRHGGGQPVDVSVSRHDNQVIFRVRDRGPGISDGNRSRIFDRFFTTERDHGGTGLGLAIVRAVAETRGGRIHVDTGPAGTTFTLVV